MTMKQSTSAAPLAVGLTAVAAVAAYFWAFLSVESNVAVLGLLALAALAAIFSRKIAPSLDRAMDEHDCAMHGAILAALLVLIALFAEDHFPLLMFSTTLLYMTAALGLNIQFGYAGIVNFAGAAFFGIGSYTSAVLTAQGLVPPILILVLGGIIAAAIGFVLILPVLRTRGHYSAVVTIAFSVLFVSFLQVNDVLGGPQGLSVGAMSLLGWDFGTGPTLFGVETSFYVNYALASVALAALAFTFTRRLERSWLGLSLDAVRLDETASACCGIGIRRAKVLAFGFGNLLIGLAGALFGMMIGYIAPTSFTFSDSLLMVAIVLLGGMGSLWGTALAAAIVVLLPEKLQVLQEYRFLLFSVMVIAMLLFRPQGLLPRGVRRFVPGWRPAE